MLSWNPVPSAWAGRSRPRLANAWSRSLAAIPPALTLVLADRSVVISPEPSPGPVLVSAPSPQAARTPIVAGNQCPAKTGADSAARFCSSSHSDEPSSSTYSRRAPASWIGMLPFFASFQTCPMSA